MVARRMKIITLSVLLLPSITAAEDTQPTDDSASSQSRHERINEIVSMRPDERTDAHQREALELLSEALEEDPDADFKRRQKLMFELMLGRLEDAHDTSRQVFQRSGSAEDRLYHCMLRERLERPAEGCYEEVIQQIETDSQTPWRDLNYLVALKLGKPDRFEEVMDTVQEEDGHRDPTWADEYWYELLEDGDRQEILREVTPAPQTERR